VRLDNEAVDGDAEKLKAEDLGSVTDLCYQAGNQRAISVRLA
jgi:hypothetical protein